MSRARRLDKLEPAIHERWSKHWEAYMERVLDRMPEAAHNLLATEWTPLSADEDAELTVYEESLFTELELEPKAWVTWYKKTEAAQPEHYEGKSTPYQLTPERIPKPPHDPGEALATVHGWTYPHTREGLSRAAVALVLALAVEVSHIG